MTSSTGVDLRIILLLPLKQVLPWVLSVILVSLAGYPGVICATPMAWLLALRVGNLAAWQSRSAQPSRRLIEAALAGGFFGFLQGILFAVVTPLMGSIQPDEITRTIVLVLILLAAGICAGAGLSFFTAYLNEQRRSRETRS